MATNAKCIKDEFLSRVYCDKFNQITREGRAIVDLMCAPVNERRRILKDKFVGRQRWFHAMTCLLNQMIKCGVMLEAKTPFLDAMIPKILANARRKGIIKSSERPRAITRLKAAARVFIKWRAIYLVFCSEVSPFKGTFFLLWLSFVSFFCVFLASTLSLHITLSPYHSLHSTHTLTLTFTLTLAHTLTLTYIHSHSHTHIHTHTK